MAHILFITFYYPPEKAAAAIQVSETATRLVKRGHQVTVLTTVPNYPTGIVPLKYRGRLAQQEIIDGVQVIRVWSYVSHNRNFLRRILAHISFGFLTPLLGWYEAGAPDIVIVESHPLFNTLAGRILAWGKQCPLIVMVSDLWPASAVQLGVLRNRLLIRLAEWLEWSTYQRASLIWVVTDGIRQSLLRRGLSAERMFLLTNGVDTKLFRPLPRTQARAELGWDNRFTVLYSGNHGLAQKLTTVLEAAERLQSSTDIRFVFVGDGTTKANLVAQAQERNLKNVTFLASQPHDRVPQLLAAADVCLVPLQKGPLFEGTLPIKMFDAMACARPILLGADGEARHIAEKEAHAALYVEPENAEALVAGILYLQEHPKEAELLGQRGRAFVELYFDRIKLTADLDARIKTLLEKKRLYAESGSYYSHMRTIIDTNSNQ